MSAPRTSAELRQSFLDFFAEKGHTVVPSAPLVPHDDPTLLFINAGMNPFKDVFLGTGTRPYVRAADTQKCLRVSGKHNDLDEVGLDTYHHTFFEMLGNWSFGDYFKAEAIRWAWELLTDRWGLDPARLYATVHEGDPGLGLGPDDEAADLWRTTTTIPHAHILRQPSKDNFWMMGDTGPCGPCTEIHVDLRADAERTATDGASLVNTDDPRVMEIWNLVFIQYNARVDAGQTRLEPLAARHVDTGMGFERVAAVLQGKTSNYDTDLFAPILAATARAAGLPDGPDGQPAYDTFDEATPEGLKTRVAMRVVADHVRTLAFAISDGAAPSNTGRGYVVRRILRRAVRYGYDGLGITQPFLHSLVHVVADHMGDAFPEVRERAESVARTVRGEEEAFLRTLAGGIDLFEAVADSAGGDPGGAGSAAGESRALRTVLANAFGDAPDANARLAQSLDAQTIPGEVVFLLHDTYGFPADLTALMARERGLAVDEARFEELMEKQRTRARAAAGFAVDHNAATAAWSSEADDTATGFLGYDALEATARVLRTRTLGEGEAARHEVVLDRTPFYAESGGQVGDTGVLEAAGASVRVLDTQKVGAATVHVVEALPFADGAEVTARVDAARRARIHRHHTATHLLHAALRERLGEHVEQRGSRVDAERLRFDFSNPERVAADDLRAVEARINAFVLAAVPLDERRDVPIDEAKAAGALALFGEKYGERVRVIRFDPAEAAAPGTAALPRSVELCGGTHAATTAEVGLVRIVSEGSVASGIRRVEAVAGEAALEWLAAEMAELEAARGLFRQTPDGLAAAVEAVQTEAKTLAREVQAARAAQAAAGLDALLADAVEVEGVRVVTARLDGQAGEALRDLADQARARLGERGVVVFGAATDGKVVLACGVSDALSAALPAGRLVGDLAKAVGGGGGGRPTLATAGGKDAAALDGALASVGQRVRERLA